MTLKTLKDRQNLDKIGEELRKRQDNGEIITLKTLKDLITYLGTGNSSDDEIVKVNKLKAEAVKRIKNCSCCKVYGLTYIYDNDKLVEKRMERELCLACERDKWFNNLTEEDLKEKQLTNSEEIGE